MSSPSTSEGHRHRCLRRAQLGAFRRLPAFLLPDAVEARLIGWHDVGSGIQVAPTFGAQARFGTEPSPSSAPRRPGRTLLLDNVHHDWGRQPARILHPRPTKNCPPPPAGSHSEGKPSTRSARSARAIHDARRWHAVGPHPQGLWSLRQVHHLSSALSGASMITDPLHTNGRHDGYRPLSLLALDRPGCFPRRRDFPSAPAVTAFCDTRCAPQACRPNRPILVAVDPSAAPPPAPAKPASRPARTFGPRFRDIALRLRAKWIMTVNLYRPARRRWIPEIHERRDAIASTASHSISVEPSPGRARVRRAAR